MKTLDFHCALENANPNFRNSPLFPTLLEELRNDHSIACMYDINTGDIEFIDLGRYEIEDMVDEYTTMVHDDCESEYYRSVRDVTPVEEIPDEFAQEWIPNMQTEYDYKQLSAKYDLNRKVCISQ